MGSEIGSVILASAQSVGKVYVIGAVGFLAVKCTCLTGCLPLGGVTMEGTYRESSRITGPLLNYVTPR
jgi:hypothetical protein